MPDAADVQRNAVWGGAVRGWRAVPAHCAVLFSVRACPHCERPRRKDVSNARGTARGDEDKTSACPDHHGPLHLRFAHLFGVLTCSWRRYVVRACGVLCVQCAVCCACRRQCAALQRVPCRAFTPLTNLRVSLTSPSPSLAYAALP